MLDTYALPPAPARPVACVDEGGRQRIGDVREPLPVRPGGPAEEDGAHRRGGVADLFLALEPLDGWRHVGATERRTGVDFARFVRWLSDEKCPAADRIVRVCDNLSTHAPAARYEAFPPAEARRLAERIDWHPTPRHGSRLNVAGMELGVLARQCLDRRIPDMATRKGGVAAWEKERNAAAVKAEWPFTTADARIKRKRLYPTIHLQ